MLIARYTFKSNTDTLPTFNSDFTYTYTDVNNGDGTITRTITSDALPSSIKFSNKSRLISVSYLDISNVTDMGAMFQHCNNLTSIELSNWNTSNVTDMSAMFGYCVNLTSLDISSWNTNNVTNMGYMFYNCKKLTSLDLSSFNTSKVYNMSNMFQNCNLLTTLDISNFNTEKINYIDNMFYGCSNLVSIYMSNSDTNSVNKIIGYLPTKTINTYELIYDESLTITPNSIKDIRFIYNGTTYDYTSLKRHNDSSSLYDVIGIDFIEFRDDSYNGQNIYEIYCVPPLGQSGGLPTGVTCVVGSYGTLKIGSIDSMDVDYIQANSKYWNIEKETESLTIAEYTFNSSTDTLPTFNSDFTYNYTDVDNGDGTITRTITSDSLPSKISFNHKIGLISLSYLDTSNVTNMSGMFNECYNLTSLDVSSFNTSNVITMSDMFYNCESLTSLDLSNFDTSNATTMSQMFAYCYNLTTLDISSFNTSKVTSMFCMFHSCESLTSLDLSNFDTSNVTNMGAMFINCPVLTSLDLSNFDTSKVEIMEGMFMNCIGLTSLDLSNFDTSKVTNMDYIFSGCTNLTSLDLSNFNTSKVTNAGSMFNDCTNLTSIDMENSDANSINKILTTLLIRASDSYGTITVSKDVFSSVDTSTANSKYWIVSPDSTNIRHMHLGDMVISNLYIGEVEVKKIYLGEIIIYK